MAHRAGGDRRGGDAHLVYPQTAVGGPADGGYATVHSSHYFKRGDDGDDRLITLVGFELLMAQELLVVHQKTPFGSGDVYAAGDGGQRLWRADCRDAGVRSSGLREVATGGMLLSAFSFLGLALTDFSTQQWLAWGLMTLLGFSVASALLASSSAIMAAAPEKRRRPGRSKPWPMSWALASALPCSA